MFPPSENITLLLLSFGQQLWEVQMKHLQLEALNITENSLA